MKSSFGRYNFRWLLAPDAAASAMVDESLTVRRMDYPIATALGTAWVEALDLSEGLSLYRAVHHLQNAPFGQLVPILDVTTSEPERVFSAQIWLSGIGCHQEYCQGRDATPVQIWGRPGQDTFRLKQGWDATV